MPDPSGWLVRALGAMRQTGRVSELGHDPAADPDIAFGNEVDGNRLRSAEQNCPSKKESNHVDTG